MGALYRKSDKDFTGSKISMFFTKINAKNLQQNNSKLNPELYKKDDILWQNGVYPRNARLVQHSKISVIYYI